MFTLDGYRELLSSFLVSGYEFRLFDDYVCPNRCVYLRHDLDFCVDYALPIATLEAEYNIKSTFFVLINSKLYNLFDEDNIRILKRISQMGHMICMHVDEQSLNEKNTFEHQMCAFLDMLPFASSRFISRHRPNVNSSSSSWLPKEVVDVYCSSYFKEIEYASDSRGEWRYGYPTDREAFIKKRSFQLLTHPIWWIHDNNVSNNEKIQLMLEHRLADCEQSLSFLNFNSNNKGESL